MGSLGYRRHQSPPGRRGAQAEHQDGHPPLRRFGRNCLALQTLASHPKHPRLQTSSLRTTSGAWRGQGEWTGAPCDESADSLEGAAATPCVQGCSEGGSRFSRPPPVCRGMAPGAPRTGETRLARRGQSDGQDWGRRFAVPMLISGQMSGVRSKYRRIAAESAVD